MDIDQLPPDDEAMKHGHSFTHSSHHHTGHPPSHGMFPLDPEHDQNSNVKTFDPPVPPA